MRWRQERKVLLSIVVKRVLKHRAWVAAFVLLVVIGGLLFALASVSAQSQQSGISITFHFDANMELDQVAYGQQQPDIVIVDKGQMRTPTRGTELQGLQMEDAARLAKGTGHKKDHVKFAWYPSNSGCVTVDGVSYCW